jgi:maleate cis-trans isomerase
VAGSDLEGDVDVVDRERHSVHADVVGARGFGVERRRVDVLEQLETAKAVRRFEQRELDVIAVESDGCVGPLTADGVEPDAIVQVGTNLSMVGLAAEAERWLHKPVIAINAATWWMALRANGIEDKFYGYGRMFEDF